ncbi:fibronectin type III domain-containing protein [uncultured Aquimarina sp.]|uniref:InlB B-repeat-containing protein n=1 Tax=uncultured Aquimarina sp. TaxID=575652 RepID=UPI0026355590|nr:fibronectin type III domain-containing protein [uncultured Aquimarina sp.]
MNSRKNLFFLVTVLLFSIFVNARNNKDGENLKMTPGTTNIITNVKLLEQSAPLSTVGITTVGDRTIANTNRRAMPYTMTENGVLQSIAVHITAGGGDMQLGVYSDNNGVPGPKLGQTAETTANSSAGWQTIALESPVVVNNGQKIWLAWIFSGGGTSISYIVGGGLENGRYSASGTSWSVGGDNMPTNIGNGSQGDWSYSIYANYSTGQGPTTFTLTTNTVGQGAVNGGGIYNEGSSVSITAIPVSGWQFDGWSGALSGSTNPDTVVLNADKSVTATFSEIVDNEAPSVPSGLTASSTTSNSTNLSWIASTDNIGVSGYDISQNGTVIGTSTAANFNVTGLSAETTYSFAVRAKDASGNISSNSASINVTTIAIPTQLFTVGITTIGTSTSTHADRRAMPYTMPENGTLQSIAIHVVGGSGDIQLGVYADNNGVPSNKLGQTTVTSVNTTTGWQTIALENPITISNGDTIWLAWMLSTNPGVAYVTGSPGRYSAAGTTWSTSGNNIPSSYGSGSQANFRYSIYANYTQFVDTQAPSAPANLTSSNVRNTSVDLSWNASTDDIGVSGYDVYQGNTIIGTPTTASYSVNGLTANTGYSFSVRAKDAAGNVSANSSVINVTTTNVAEYTLTINTVGQGTVSGGGSYNNGETATVTATAAAGWEFTGWSGALSGTVNPSSVTMNANKSVTATFTEAIVISTSTEKYRLTWRTDPSTTMVIGWNQVRGTNPVVHYGTTDFGSSSSSYPLSKTVDRTVSSKGMNNNYARLTGLQPDTAYYFVIRDSEGVSERYWFKTAPNDPTTRLSIVAGGDSRNNRTPRQNANRLVAKIRPHVVLFGGDMTSSSNSSQWQNWFNDWQLTIGSDGRMIPVVAARGNHESSNDIRDLFDIPTGAGGEYYALSFGGNLMRTYTLNTEVTPAGTQGTWLANDLAANSASHTWAVAQYHRSTRPHEPGKSEQNDQYEAWSKPFYTHAVQLVMESDSHVVKRTWPIKPSTDTGSDEGFVRVDNDPKRAVYVGEGCWGAPLRGASDTKNWTRAAGSFNQFKWLWVDQNQIIMRTIKVDNASSVGQVNDNNLFSLPSNIDVWNPAGGSVVTIDNPHSLVVRSNVTTSNIKSSEFDLNVHPNPVKSGLLHITYPSHTTGQESKAIIRDMFGRLVDQITLRSKTETYKIDKLNTGVYFVCIKEGKRKISIKFIKK